ncbi:MAG: tetratricopeptide repeat protein [Pyrinomonadaceae bacterium]
MKYLRTRIIWLLAVTICLAMLSSFAQAHEGLHEQIVAITAKIKRDPKNATLYLQRGELHRLHREWTRAAADYDRAARLEPELKVIDLVRGKMLLESGRLQRARVTLDRFLTQQPSHFEGLVTRARVLAGLGATNDAIKDFTEALAVSPDPELYLERAHATAPDSRVSVRDARVSGRDATQPREQKRIEDALNGLDEGSKRLGPVVTLQLAAIDLELRRHNYDAALARLDIVMSQSERKETWLVRRGEILALAGRKDEARSSFQDALTAIDSLPPSRRQTRSMTALQLRIRSALGAR